MGNIRGGTLGFHGTIGQPTAQVIDGSLRFDDGSSQYFGRTPGSVGNRRTWTASFWTKSNPSGSTKQTFFQCRVNNNSDDTGIGLENDKIRVVTGTVDAYITSRVLRDPCAWYHIVVVFDTTQSTDSDRVKVYVNSELDTGGTTSYPSQNTEWSINTTNLHAIGRHEGVDSQYIDAYISQFYLIDGLALGPGYFGFTDPLTGTWRPRKFRAVGTTVNDGTQWSSYLSNSTGASNLFDGSLSTTYGPDGNTQTFTPPNPIIVKNSLRIYYSSGVTSRNFEVNDNGNVVATGLGTKWVDLNFTGPLRKLSGTNGWNVRAIEVDGVIMQDSTTTNLDFGTNGFYLPMDNQDDFEKDKSGKGNDWTKNNFSGTSINPDVLKDSPSGAVSGGRAQTGITTTSSAPANYATLNPTSLPYSASGDTRMASLSNGNLTYDGVTSYWGPAFSTIPLGKTGKYYFETIPAGGGNVVIGVGKLLSAPGNRFWDQGTGTQTFFYSAGGNIINNSSTLDSSPASFGDGDVIGFAMDCDRNIGKFYKNGVLQATVAMPAAVITAKDAGTVFPFCDTYNGIDVVWNFGQKPFKYAPPQGYLPLNSATVRPNKVIARSDQYVGVATYRGTGSAFDLNFNFRPDFAWIKGYTYHNANHQLSDTVRNRSAGGIRRLELPTTAAQDAGGPKFTPTGLNITTNAALNTNNQNYVAYAWKAGGDKNTFNIDDVGYATAAAAGLDGGDLTVTGASVGTKQGFSIIKYTGSGNAGDSASHGLLEAPKFIITKNIDNGTYSWRVFTTAIDGSNDRLFLNGDNSKADQTDAPVPTSSVFYVGANLDHNKDDDNIIAYLWHDVPGLQKFGSFKSNANSDGPYIELGFRPALIWVKVVDATDNWACADQGRAPVNPSDSHLRLNASDAEVNASGNYKIDLLSNGFKIRGTNGEYNANAGDDYIYCAWAQAPASNLFGGQSNAR